MNRSPTVAAFPAHRPSAPRLLWTTAAACLQIGLSAAVAAGTPPAANRPPTPGRPLRFEHLTILDGLSNTWVQAILKDRRGFMWFGTQEGLNRYDGSSFRVYGKEDADGCIAPFSAVASLFEDSRGRLWAGSTWAGPGLAVYDRAKDRFRCLPRRRGSPLVRVTAIAEAADGRLWLSTDAGLELVDPDRGSTLHFAHVPASAAGLPSNSVNVVRVDGRGRVWVGTAEGLARAESTGAVSLVPLRGAGGDALPDVRDVLEDDDGTLWLSTATNGLYHLDPDTGTPRRYVPPPLEGGVPANLRRMVGDGRGRIYLGSENGGLHLFDPATKRWTRHLPDPWDDTTLASSSIWSLHRDDQGILWVGTFNAGVDLVSPLGQRFRSIRPRHGGLRNPFVSSLLEGQEGELWIGTDGGGLNRLDRVSGEFRYYDAPALGSPSVLSLYQDRGGVLWIGTWAGGLVRLDPRSGRITRFRHDARDPTTLAMDNIWDILETPAGELLLAGQDGVDLFDPRTGRARRLSSLYDGAGGGMYFSALRDRRGNYWLGRNNGLEWIEAASGRVRTYPEHLDENVGLGPYAVFDVAEDRRGNIWAATEWGGLVSFRAGDGAQRRYDTRDGLPAASVASILADANGDLWLGTTRGICRFEGASELPQQPRILCFDVRDGLQGYVYSRGTRWRCRNGEMLFGGHGGLDAFFPQDIVANPTRPPVVLTGLRLSTRPVAVGAPGSPLPVSLSEARELTFAYDEPVLTFEFAALNYLVPRKNQYRYRLLGLHDEWSVASGEHSATYTNLSPGSYELQVRASNNDGVWNDEGTSLRIRVTPPFWGAAWFRLLVALAVAGGLARLYRRRAAALEARRAQTRARYQAILDERTRLAREIHDTLEQAMAAIRLQLSTVARQLKAAPEQASRNLALARRMLDHSLEEARRSVMDLRAQALERADLVEAITRQSREMTSGTPVEVAVSARGTVRRLEAAEEHHLLRIAQEALTNALKHSGGSRVEVEIRFAEDSTTLVVKDDGKGLAQGDAAPDGHFGLQGIRERTDRLGAELDIQSRPGAGVEISVTVPARLARRPGQPVQ